MSKSKLPKTALPFRRTAYFSRQDMSKRRWRMRPARFVLTPALRWAVVDEQKAPSTSKVAHSRRTDTTYRRGMVRYCKTLKKNETDELLPFQDLTRGLRLDYSSVAAVRRSTDAVDVAYQGHNLADTSSASVINIVQSALLSSNFMPNYRRGWNFNVYPFLALVCFFTSSRSCRNIG